MSRDLAKQMHTVLEGQQQLELRGNEACFCTHVIVQALIKMLLPGYTHLRGIHIEWFPVYNYNIYSSSRVSLFNYSQHTHNIIEWEWSGLTTPQPAGGMVAMSH